MNNSELISFPSFKHNQIHVIHRIQNRSSIIPHQHTPKPQTKLKLVHIHRRYRNKNITHKIRHRRIRLQRYRLNNPLEHHRTRVQQQQHINGNNTLHKQRTNIPLISKQKHRLPREHSQKHYDQSHVDEVKRKPDHGYLLGLPYSFFPEQSAHQAGQGGGQAGSDGVAHADDVVDHGHRGESCVAHVGGEDGHHFEDPEFSYCHDGAWDAEFEVDAPLGEGAGEDAEHFDALAPVHAFPEV